MKGFHISLVASLLAGTVTAQNSTIQCPTGTGVAIIVARASTESPGTGIIGAIANNVVAQIPGSTIAAVDYPATLENYQMSEAKGVASMAGLMQQFNAKCGASKMVLMGYSQGAQVAADVVCGTTEVNFAPTPPVLSDNVVAMVLMGDPSFTPQTTFVKGGTSQNTGIFPRQGSAACGTVAARTLSICNSQDKFCDSGDSLDVHLSYIQTNGPQATEFVVKAVKGL